LHRRGGSHRRRASVGTSASRETSGVHPRESSPFKEGWCYRFSVNVFPVLIVVTELSLARAHTVAAEGAELLQSVEAFTSRVLLVVIVHHVAKLVALNILVEHVGLLHDGVAHGDVGVGQREVEHMLAHLPEVDGLLQSLNKREMLPVDDSFLDLFREELPGLRDKDIAGDKLLHVLDTSIVDLKVINIYTSEVHFLVISVYVHSHFPVQVSKNLELPFVLELWRVRLLDQVRPNNCKVVVELTGTVHQLHILLNSRVSLGLGVIGKVFEVAETVWVAADLIILVQVPLIVVLLVENEVLSDHRLVLVCLLKELLVHVNLLALLKELILCRDTPISDHFPDLVPHSFVVLVSQLFRVEPLLVFDFLKNFLNFILLNFDLTIFLHRLGHPSHLQVLFGVPVLEPNLELWVNLGQL
jgi:hypothetical protein